MTWNVLSLALKELILTRFIRDPNFELFEAMFHQHMTYNSKSTRTFSLILLQIFDLKLKL